MFIYSHSRTFSCTNMCSSHHIETRYRLSSSCDEIFMVKLGKSPSNCFPHKTKAKCLRESSNIEWMCKQNGLKGKHNVIGMHTCKRVYEVLIITNCDAARTFTEPSKKELVLDSLRACRTGAKFPRRLPTRFPEV